MMGLPPNLEKRFLKHVVRFGFFMDDAADQGAAGVVEQQVGHEAEAVDGRLELLWCIWLGEVDDDALDADVVGRSDLVGDVSQSLPGIDRASAFVAVGNRKVFE